MQRNPVTPEGYAALEAELRRYRTEYRPQNVKDIEEARAHGDISENAEFEAAKERQAMIDGRIRELEGLVASAEVIDVAKVPRSGRVVFGTTVVLEDPDSGEARRWTLVGRTESDVENGRISFETPVGRALIGREEGEEVVIPTPGGRQTWEIVEVLYGDGEVGD